MISDGVIMGFGFSLVISVVLPIALAIVFYKKFGYKALSLILGVIVFVVFQLLVRLQIISVLEQQFSISTALPFFVYALFMAFTAGLFEEAGRFIAFNFILKDKRDFGNALAFGVGHGGVEAIILVGITMVNNIILSTMINSGMFEEAYSTVLAAEEMAQIKNALLDVTTAMSYAAGVERMSTLAIQIGLTLLIVNGFRVGKKWMYLIYAIIAHTLVNLFGLYASNWGMDFFIIELIIAGFAILAIWYINYSKNTLYREE